MLLASTSLLSVAQLSLAPLYRTPHNSQIPGKAPVCCVPAGAHYYLGEITIHKHDCQDFLHLLCVKPCAGSTEKTEPNCLTHKVFMACGDAQSPCQALHMNVTGFVKQPYEVRTIISPLFL